MFDYLITIQPLGLMYGSAGGFLSPENLVGRSRSKFPPEAATLSGLFFSANKVKPFTTQADLRENLYVAGPFWGLEENIRNFYLPIPWTRIVSDDGLDEWTIQNGTWHRQNPELQPAYSWQTVDAWQSSLQEIQTATAKLPWKFVPILHPKLQAEERHVEAEDGLFLEYAVQMSEETCLIYLATHPLPDGWYRFGGEGHIVDIKTHQLDADHPIITLLKQPIDRAFALITPGVWGSTRLSYRYPQHPDFPEPAFMLTDRPIPYRFRAAGRMGRGRYAVSAGTVCILSQPLNKSWWEWSDDWFPNEGYSLKRVGCGLCLPVAIEGVC